MDVDEVADELYGLHPQEFMAARTEHEQRARADGDRALAADIKALGKPSTPAWVCNVLVRHHRDEIAGLVELGGLLREAQQNFAGDELKALDVQRRKLVGALTRQARALANRLGHPVTTAVATQIEETLRAAMADPEAGEALLAGRLTAPMTYSGLGTGARPDLRVVPSPKEPKESKAAARPAEKSRRADAASREQTRREEARRAAEERRRRELDDARRARDEAAAAAEEAAQAADDERRHAGDLAARHDALVDRVEELTLELSRVREEATRLGSERSRAERRREAAEHRSADAERARDRAQKAVDRLEHAP